MQKNYVIGFPRIGEKRELKKVLEQYWSKQTDFRAACKFHHHKLVNL